MLNLDSETKIDTLTENEVPLLELTNLQTPEEFEFKTSDEVSITINYNIPNDRYDIYAFNDTAQIGEEITFVDDEGQPDTIKEYKSDVLNQLLFTGVALNGFLER